MLIEDLSLARVVQHSTHLSSFMPCLHSSCQIDGAVRAYAHAHDDHYFMRSKFNSPHWNDHPTNSFLSLVYSGLAQAHPELFLLHAYLHFLSTQRPSPKIYRFTERIVSLQYRDQFSNIHIDIIIKVAKPSACIEQYYDNMWAINNQLMQVLSLQISKKKLIVLWHSRYIWAHPEIITKLHLANTW